MLTPNQIYDYLRYYISTNEKSSIVRSFKDGSKNPLNLFFHQDNSNSPYVSKDIDRILKYDGFIDMYDQEPIDFVEIRNQYRNDGDNHLDNLYPELEKLSDLDFFLFLSASMCSPIICHSEKNSYEIETLKKHNFIDVHYWIHGLISRFWYSEFRLLLKNEKRNPKRFGIYAREFNGTRSYRLKLLKELSKISENVYYRYPLNDYFNFFSVWKENQEDISANSSAYINWIDHERFDIHLVAETLFDTSKTHLTEKVFKPIVMYQPFIILGGPGSLKYLKDYGFKTFDSCWDESYDLETDSIKRFNKIVDVINSINELDDFNYRQLIAKTRSITEYNRNLFYSEEFNMNLMNELMEGLDKALKIQEESFTKNPGGNLFSLMDKMYKTKDDINPNHKKIIKGICNKLKEDNPELLSQLKLKYSKLINE